MRIMFVCSGNSGGIAPFIKEQANALKKEGFNITFFLIKGKGLMGYLNNYLNYKKAINNFKPELIHAHYGLSGLFANLQRRIPVVTTYHGSDINNSKVRPFSKIAAKLSVKNIFVSQKLLLQVHKSVKNVFIPCGINTSVFYHMDKMQARQEMGFTPETQLVLFSSAFTNAVKNYPLAKNAIKKLKNVLLIELKGYSPEEVNLLCNACDIALMTSFTEGSPQFIKENMACNTPIVSTNVGDVDWLFCLESGHFISNFTPENVVNKIRLALQYSSENKETKGRNRILDLGLNSKSVAKKIILIYKDKIKS